MQSSVSLNSPVFVLNSVYAELPVSIAINVFMDKDLFREVFKAYGIWVSERNLK